MRKAVLEACKNGDLDGGFSALDEMIAKVLNPTTHIYNAVLSLCTRAAGGIDAVLLSKAQAVFRSMQAAGLAEEAAFTSIIRICALAGDAAAARSHLDAAEAIGVPLKLRSFAPMLAAYADQRDAANAEWVWQRLCSAGFRPSQTEYAALIEVVAREGGSRAANVVPRLLSALAMHEYRLEPTAANAIRAYFAGEFEPRKGEARGVSDLPPQPLAPSDVLTAAADSSATHPAAAGWPWHVAEVAIPRSRQRHVCPATGVRLASLELSDEDLAGLAGQAAVLAEGAAGRSLEAFRAWLKRATDDGKRPFDSVVDGANIGFTNQNFGGGALMYTQVRLDAF